MKKIILTLIFLVFIFKNIYPQVQENVAIKEEFELKEVIKKINLILKNKNVPGLSISIIKNDSIVYSGGMGMADCDKNIPCSQKTIFRAASIAKSFVSLGLLKLVSEGKLNLTDKLSAIAPEIKFKNKWEKTNPILIIHLLEHTTGFDDWHSDEQFSNVPNIPIAIAIQKNNRSKECKWKPGAFYSYSNVNYGIAGFVIEKITGQKFDDYLSREILKPLGMNNSSFKLTQEIKNTLAIGYDYNCKEIVPFKFGFLRPSMCLTTTAEDLGKFTLFLINNGRIDGKQIVDSSVISSMKRSETVLVCKEGIFDDLGKGIKAYHYNKIRIFGHSGDWDGFKSSYSFSSTKQFGWVILFNSKNEEAFYEIEDILLDFLTRNLTPPEFPLSQPADKTKLKSYAGTFIPTMGRHKIYSFASYFQDESIQFSNDTLSFADKKLIPFSDSLFKDSYSSGVNCAFIANENRDLIFFSKSKGHYLKVNPTLLFIKKSIITLSGLIIFGYLFIFLFWFLRQIIKRRQLSLRKLLPLMSILVFITLVVLVIIAQARQLVYPTLIAISLYSYFLISLIGIVSIFARKTGEETFFWKLSPVLVFLANLIFFTWLYPSLSSLI
jgi:CubicO group peptidase (beta-lactamase class C family)